MKIVHVLSLSAIGGVQNTFIPYFKLALKKSKFKHEICLTRDLGVDFSRSLENNYYYLKSIKGFIKLIYQIISKKYIIHFYNSLGSKPIYNLLKFLPVSKIIIHERGSAWNSTPSNFEYFVNNAKIAKKIISNSKATKHFLNLKFQIPLEKINVIYNGIQEKKINTTSIIRFSNKISIGYLGRFETQKGIPSFIKAAKILSQYNFYLAGYGPWESYILKEIKKEKNIFLIGKTKNPLEFLNKIDILVVPSLREPFGNVIVEAGFCRKAVIASNVDGISEIINTHKMGILIEPKDNIDFKLRPLDSLMYPEKVYSPLKKQLVKPLYLNPKELAIKIKEVAENESLRKELGESLFKNVSNRFCLNNYFENTEKFYSDSIK